MSTPELITWKKVMHRAKKGNPTPPKRIEKSQKQWKSTLANDVFTITRLKGTERPWSSELCSKFEPGLYACACCQTRLFDASEKFESYSGWPSFTQPVEDSVVGYLADSSHGMTRIEIVCNCCDAHLGHVFPDGPAPTGLRYCMNALSLDKV